MILKAKEFYEGEIQGMKELLEFSMRAFWLEVKELKKDIEGAHSEKS